MNTLHANFNGGLMTPLMGGRFDTDKLRTGCRVLKNMIPSVYGGVFKRPGTQYVGTAKNDGAPRLHGFRRSAGINYMLEFGAEYVRFWKKSSSQFRGGDVVTASGVSAWQTSTAYVVGDYVTNGGSTYYCIEAHTSGTFLTDLAADKWVAQTALEIPTPYSASDVFELQFCQLNDVLFIAHPDHAPRRLTRNSETDWTLEIVPWQFAPVLDVNESAIAVQLQYNEDDWATSTGYVVGDRVVNDGELYTCFNAHTSGATTEPGTGASWTTAWNVGTSSENIPAWANATSYTAGDKVKLGNVLYLCTANHTSLIGNWFSGTVGRGNRPGDGAVWVNFWTIYAGVYDLAGMSFRLAASADVFASTDVDTTWQLNIGTPARSVSISTASTGESEWVFIQGPFTLATKWATGSGLVGSIVLDESLDNVTSQVVRQWASEANDGNISYEGEAPDQGAWYRVRVFNTSGGQNNVTLQPSESVLRFPFRVDSYTDAKTVLGRLIMPNDQSPPAVAVGNSTTSYHKPAFTSVQGYPRTVAFHDGRLWWAGTEQQGSRLWASKVDDFYTYLTGADDDAALDLSLASTEANQIQWIASHNRALVVGTSSQEWTIDGGDSETVITPSNRRARFRTAHGSANLPAVVLSEALLWVTKQGSKIREFTYQFQSDAFTAPDMTALIGTLPRKVKQIAYTQVVDPILWVVDQGGQLFGFSYDREQQVTAWHQHTTGNGDSWLSVAGMGGGEDQADELWFVVSRSINGGTKRYIERMPAPINEYVHGSALTLGFTYADCFKYGGGEGFGVNDMANSGANCVVSDFIHLAGRDVVASSSTIDTGTGTLDSSGDGTISSFNCLADFSGDVTQLSNLVGLAIDSTIQAFPLDVALQDGTGQGRNWRPNRIELLLHYSFGGTYGPTADDAASPIPYPDGQSSLYSGRQWAHLDADWSRLTEVTVKHSDPFAFGLLGYILKSEVSGS